METMIFSRKDGRRPEELRPVRFDPEFNRQAEGAVLVEAGRTCVLCTASVEEKVPSFLAGTSKGWVSAEYGMLPRATATRTQREAAKGKPSGRTMEIQRLIGRSLRAVVNLEMLGPRTIWIDCDVLQADGGTRTASITGAFLAVAIACHRLCAQGVIARMPVVSLVAATSVGLIGNRILLDLDYAEDSTADVDMNVVMTGSGELVEVQGTGENRTFRVERMMEMVQVARQGIFSLHDMQRGLLQKLGIELSLPAA